MFDEIILLCVLGFIAATIDAIAGGGGLISLPALLLVGIPPHYALGTNKFAATVGSLTSSLTYARSGKVYLPVVIWQIPFTFIGTCLGVWSILHISSDFLTKAVPILILLVGFYTLLQKNLGLEDRFQGITPLSRLLGFLFAFVLGFYDGFFGPGTGSFLIFCYITLYGFNFTVSSANAKVLNFISNFVSLILFALSGKIIYTYGIPMALSMFLGSRLGTHLAIHRGSALIKPIFITMSLLVALKLVIENYM
ncbi:MULTISPECIES: TSUP family transporter [Desulfitobacterium]|uniref:Probable membrane transporter protein n=1 Tax=Desulfitobacterium dehalogenans (strain ATCC 51507 / DSM 9161 / JW/IU-DC1) TaxID=756499 RepID=I4AA73_DESDJ|nr:MULTISPECIES: TSUP family transporter [Desulfitobacterium]AFM00858.1 putative permease [Desulfitobacterium dehalogenans ATCC 51507]